MTDRPRVLLVGAGGYGEVYLQEMNKEDFGADIAGVCDINPATKTHPVIQAKGIPVYETVEDFYAQDQADLAVIVSPVHYHTQMALACLAKGSHVLCEKPLCLTLEEADAMARAAREAGKFLALGYQLNYRRDVLALKGDILAGRFGRPKRLAVYQCFRRGEKYYARNNWAGRIAVNGHDVFDSPFSNACAHNFQLMTFLLGDRMDTACDVRQVEAELYRCNPRVENYDIAALRFATEGGATLCYYTAHPLKSPELGPWGTFEFEKGRITFESDQPSFKAVLDDARVIDYSGIAPGGAMQKLYDALDCVIHGGAPVCGVAADYGHIRAVRMTQQQPVQNIRPDLRQIMKAETDTFVYVKDLEAVFAQCAANWALPSELGFALGEDRRDCFHSTLSPQAFGMDL